MSQTAQPLPPPSNTAEHRFLAPSEGEEIPLGPRTGSTDSFNLKNNLSSDLSSHMHILKPGPQRKFAQRIVMSTALVFGGTLVLLLAVTVIYNTTSINKLFEIVYYHHPPLVNGTSPPQTPDSAYLNRQPKRYSHVYKGGGDPSPAMYHYQGPPAPAQPLPPKFPHSSQMGSKPGPPASEHAQQQELADLSVPPLKLYFKPKDAEDLNPWETILHTDMGDMHGKIDMGTISHMVGANPRLRRSLHKFPFESLTTESLTKMRNGLLREALEVDKLIMQLKDKENSASQQVTDDDVNKLEPDDILTDGYPDSKNDTAPHIRRERVRRSNKKKSSDVHMIRRLREERERLLEEAERIAKLIEFYKNQQKGSTVTPSDATQASLAGDAEAQTNALTQFRRRRDISERLSRLRPMKKLKREVIADVVRQLREGRNQLLDEVKEIDELVEKFASNSHHHSAGRYIRDAPDPSMKGFLTARLPKVELKEETSPVQFLRNLKLRLPNITKRSYLETVRRKKSVDPIVLKRLMEMRRNLLMEAENIKAMIESLEHDDDADKGDVEGGQMDNKEIPSNTTEAEPPTSIELTAHSIPIETSSTVEIVTAPSVPTEESSPETTEKIYSSTVQEQEKGAKKQEAESLVHSSSTILNNTTVYDYGTTQQPLFDTNWNETDSIESTENSENVTHRHYHHHNRHHKGKRNLGVNDHPASSPKSAYIMGRPPEANIHQNTRPLTIQLPKISICIHFPSHIPANTVVQEPPATLIRPPYQHYPQLQPFPVFETSSQYHVHFHNEPTSSSFTNQPFYWERSYSPFNRNETFITHQPKPSTFNHCSPFQESFTATSDRTEDFSDTVGYLSGAEQMPPKERSNIPAPVSRNYPYVFPPNEFDPGSSVQALPMPPWPNRIGLRPPKPVHPSVQQLYQPPPENPIYCMNIPGPIIQIPVKPVTDPGCPTGFIPCRDRSGCVPEAALCDGSVQCNDASDEMQCSCRQRIAHDRLCDGYFDCPDGEDELGCLGCHWREFSCDDLETRIHHPSTCVSMSRRCDEIRDCPTAKDEAGCSLIAFGVTGKKTLPVSYQSGYLHRNFRGELLPVCGGVGDKDWHLQACREVVSLDVETADVRLKLAPTTYYGRWLTAENGPRIVDACPLATFVVCPRIEPGTRVPPPHDPRIRNHNTGRYNWDPSQEDDAEDLRIHYKNKRSLYSELVNKIPASFVGDPYSSEEDSLNRNGRAQREKETDQDEDLLQDSIGEKLSFYVDPDYMEIPGHNLDIMDKVVLHRLPFLSPNKPRKAEIWNSYDSKPGSNELQRSRYRRNAFQDHEEEERLRRDARVVGGHPAKPGAWPWIVGLYQDGSFCCGGAIINENWIMTAAHCVYEYQEKYLQVQAGVLRRYSFSPTEQIRLVDYVKIHDKYNAEDLRNDIALIHLKEPLQFNRWVRPVGLATWSTEDMGPQDPPPGMLCTAVGWGATQELGPVADHVREVQVPILSHCTHAIDILSGGLCAGFKNGGKDACQGDSGGPLLCSYPKDPFRYYAAGIISHGEGCAHPNEPGAYTRVSRYINWILEHTGGSKSMKEILFSQSHKGKVPSLECPGIQCQSGPPRCISVKNHCDRIVDCLKAEDERCDYSKTDYYVTETFPLIPYNYTALRMAEGDSDSRRHHNDSSSIIASSVDTNNGSVASSKENEVPQKTSSTFNSTTLNNTEETHVQSLLISVHNSNTTKERNVSLDNETSAANAIADEIKAISPPNNTVTSDINADVSGASKTVIADDSTYQMKNETHEDTEGSDGQNSSTPTKSVASIPTTETEISAIEGPVRENATVVIPETSTNSPTVIPPTFVGTSEGYNSSATNSTDVSSLLSITETPTQEVTPTTKMPETDSFLTQTFQCNSTAQIVPLSRRCDRLVDCVDGSDEDNCKCRDYLLASQPSAVCDGTLDCLDGTDEMDCHLCPAGEMLCSKSSDKICVPRRFECDGKTDCLHGEDEAGCLALSDGSRLQLDSEGQPIIHEHGILVKKVSGQWRPLCFKARPAIRSPSVWAADVCNSLGFPGWESFNETEIGDKEIILSSPRVLPLHGPMYSLPNDQKVSSDSSSRTCTGLRVRCTPGVEGNESTFLLRPTLRALPWHAEIFANGIAICTGVLINDRWILTSQDCFRDIDISSHYVSALLGGPRSELGVVGPFEQVRRIDSQNKIPGSAGLMLHLETPTVFSRLVRPTGVPEWFAMVKQALSCVAIGRSSSGSWTTVPLEHKTICPHGTSPGKSCFIGPINDSCLNKTSQQMEPWTGVIACKASSGWYPAAVYSIPDLCGLQGNVAFDAVYFMIRHLKNLMEVTALVSKMPAPQCSGLRCPLGRCLSLADVCNGAADCRSAVDENASQCELLRQACDTGDNECVCKPNELRCNFGGCVPQNKFCDGYVDCRDGSDEPPECSCSAFLRQTRPALLCDGRRQCLDRTDEDPGLCPFKPGRFICTRSMRCVSTEVVCDGYKDCPDGEDEQNCFAIDVHQTNPPKGNIIRRSFGAWHSYCGPRLSDLELNALCIAAGSPGFLSSAPINSTLVVLPAYDAFSEARLNRQTRVTMRGPGALVTLRNVHLNEACQQTSVVCQ